METFLSILVWVVVTVGSGVISLAIVLGLLITYEAFKK